MEFQKSGYEHITGIIAEAMSKGENSAIVTGNWEIAKAVRLPSNFTLYLRDCHLRQQDGCFDNVFVNEHHETEAGKTLQGRDRNISIIGNGNAVIDGGKYNGLSERNTMKDGRPPIWKNNLILFTNVERFEICGISCRNQRWWAMNFIYCAHGRLHDIDFLSNDTGIDENGNEYHGLKNSKYEEILVRNSDGIDLRIGCHDISIENITGFTQDDTVAMTALVGYKVIPFVMEGLSKEIRRISVRHVHSAALCSNVRVLTQGDVAVHDILIEDVQDTSLGSPHMDRGGYGVRIGDTYMFGDRHSTADETYNITVRGVRSRAQYAIKLAGAMKNIVVENVEVFDGAQYLEDARTEGGQGNCVIEF